MRGKIASAGLIFADLKDLPLDRAPLLKPGEILVVRSGAYTGDSALITDEWTGAAPGYDLRVTPLAGSDPRFLAYTLLSTRALDEMKLASSRAAQPHLNAEELGEVTVDACTLQEQRAIVDFLDRETARIDALIDTKQQLGILLSERRKETISFGIRGLLESGDVHDAKILWAPTVRAPWPGVMIKHFATLGTGHTPSRSRPELWESAHIPWITTGEIKQVRDDRQEVINETRECVSELGIANSAAELHPAGTVVLCRTASAGYSAIMGKDMATSQDFVTWTCSEHLLPRYLLMCLRAMRDDLLGRLAYGSTHKTIYWPDIESLKIPLPTVEEQTDILRQIDKRTVPLDSAHHRLTQQVQILREHRQALITAAVTGQMDIPSAA
jgi:type I restriction enzyme S subunit